MSGDGASDDEYKGSGEYNNDVDDAENNEGDSDAM